MTMTKRTMVEIERLHTKFEGREFSKKELYNTTTVSIATLIDHGAIKRIVREHFESVSIEELVNKLNNCSNADCCGAHWEFRIINGRPFEVFTTVTFKVL